MKLCDGVEYNFENGTIEIESGYENVDLDKCIRQYLTIILKLLKHKESQLNDILANYDCELNKTYADIESVEILLKKFRDKK